MANTFKSNTKLNVGTDAVTSTNATVVTASGSSTLVLLSILLSNTSASSVDVDVALVKSGGADDTHLIKNAPVPAGSSLEIISGSKIIMEANDILRIRAGVASKIDATVSYLDQT